MILLASDCLLFQLANGESVPVSVEALSVELVGEPADSLDAEFVRNAAAAVFHYFKTDQARIFVTVGEFSLALEKVLRGFGLTGSSQAVAAPGNPEADLRLLAIESGKAELIFFPRLRNELRSQLRQSPQMLHFCGLRGCVKQLTGARRWSARCRSLQHQIVEYLRECLSAESGRDDCVLVVN